MRISIDIDGAQGAVTPQAQGATGSASGDMPNDGGGAPAGGGGSDPSASAETVSNGGSPPQWLLDAIAAAEAGQDSSVGADGQPGATASDGGPGPSA